MRPALVVGNGSDGEIQFLPAILIDDLGGRTLNSSRGFETPRVNQFASEGRRLPRTYPEPSCTPARVALMIARQLYRNGMGDTAVEISGFGLAAK